MRAWALYLLVATASSIGLSPGGNKGLHPVLIDRDDDVTNYYGDPPDGDPVTNAKCVIKEKTLAASPRIPISVARRQQLPARALSSRVVTKQPLRNPGETQDEFNEFIVSIVTTAQDDTNDLGLGISPSNSQVNSWSIRYRNADIPIGVTGIWKPFDSEPKEYATWGLHGCTAGVVAGPAGLWLGHWWEASENVNGFSSHTKRYLATKGTNKGKPTDNKRSPLEFQTVAVNILDQVTPEEERDNRYTWNSMADLRQYEGNPFSDPEQVDVWLMTVAMYIGKSKKRYEGHINQLKAKFAEILPGSHYSDDTYDGYTADDYERENRGLPMPKEILGTIAVQYSPYDHDDGCTPMARVRAFYENNQTPIIDRSWPATAEQLGNRRRGDACPASSAGSTITSPPAATPSCEYLPQDPDQGRTVAACVCEETATLPLITPQPSGTNSIFANSASCAYTTMPGSSVTNPVTTEVQTWTSNCQACTLTGGVADVETCTTVPSCTPTGAAAASTPTFAVFVSNSTVGIGDAEHEDQGKQLGRDMYNILHNFYQNRTSCKTGKENHASISNDLTITQDGDEPLKPYLYFSTVDVSDTKTFEQMLTAGLATWIRATANACEDVEYEDYADPTASGCGDGPVRRDDGVIFMPKKRTLRRCSADSCGGGDGGGEGLRCHYVGRICKTPETISIMMSNGTDPYANALIIQLDFETDRGDTAQILCEVLLEGLTDAAIALAPELAPEDIIEEMEFETICKNL